MTRLPPRADDVPYTDTDTDTDATSDTDPDPVSAIGPDSWSDTGWVGNRLDIAECEYTPEERAAALTKFRGDMREGGMHDPEKAAEYLAPNGAKVRQVALLVWCAVQCREEGREDIARAPTIDSPGGDVRPDTGKKARKGGGKSKGPKGKRSVRWLGAVGKAATWYQIPTDTDVEALIAAAAWGPSDRPIGARVAYGFVDLLNPLEPVSGIPALGGDAAYAVWGIRVESCASGCPTRRFQIQAEAAAADEARAKGYALPLPERVRELLEQKRDEWYRSATPKLDLVPVSLHRASGRLALHSRDGKIREWLHGKLAKALGRDAVSRIADPVADADTRGLHALDLHRGTPEGLPLPADRPVDIGRDWLLWLLATSTAGVSSGRTADGDLVAWHVDDAVELGRAREGEDKAVKVRVGGDVGASGALVAALADGATPKALTLILEVGALRFAVAFDGAQIRSRKLPAECKPGRGTTEEIDPCVDERLRLLDRCDEAIGVLQERFLAHRRDGWSQALAPLRAGLLQRVAERWGAAGLLFRHWLPGEQTTMGLAIEGALDSGEGAAKGKRGRRAQA